MPRNWRIEGKICTKTNIKSKLLFVQVDDLKQNFIQKCWGGESVKYFCSFVSLEYEGCFQTSFKNYCIGQKHKIRVAFNLLTYIMKL